VGGGGGGPGTHTVDFSRRLHSDVQFGNERGVTVLDCSTGKSLLQYL
jgi:hypothetical protein